MTRPTGSIIPKGVPFGQIPHALTLDLDVTNPAYRVYGLLMKLANTESRAWPGHRYLEEHLPMTRKTIALAISNLEETGWLIVNRDRQAHTYLVVVELARLDLDWSSSSPGGESTPGSFSPPTGVVLTPEPEYGLPHTDNQDRQPPTDTKLARRRSPKPEWDFLTDPTTFNLPTGTAAQRKRVGRLASEIRSKLDHENVVGYDDRWRELHARAQAWPLHFDGATLTPEALEKHLTQLGQTPLARSKDDTERLRVRAAMAALEDPADDE